MRIRALTLFAGRLEGIEDLSKRFSREANRASEEVGISIWTKRLAVHDVKPFKLVEVGQALDKLTPSVVDYVATPASSEASVEQVLSLLLKTKGVYTSIGGRGSGLDVYSSVLKSLRNLGLLERCTRLCLIINRPSFTPYFPAASAEPERFGVAAALLYVDDLRQALASKRPLSDAMLKAYASAYKLVKLMAERLGVEDYGVDLSISPWMDESVAKLVQEACGERVGAPGSYYAIYELNKALREVSRTSGVKATGFNEVMLPYAEDTVLMKLGLKGLLTAYALLSLASVCVAGFDMVVLPKFDQLDALLMDAYAILRRKGVPSGIRLIPTSFEPGSIVQIDKFGSVPVLKLS